MVIDQKYAELAVRTLHSVYELDKQKQREDGRFIYIAQDFDLALDEIRSQYQNIIVVGNRDKEFLIEHVDESFRQSIYSFSQLEIIG